MTVFAVPEVKGTFKVPLGIMFEDKEVKKSRKLVFFRKNLDCQDTEIQVVVVGAGRADLVAQTKAHWLLLNRMETENGGPWR